MRQTMLQKAIAGCKVVATFSGTTLNPINSNFARELKKLNISLSEFEEKYDIAMVARAGKYMNDGWKFAIVLREV